VTSPPPPDRASSQTSAPSGDVVGVKLHPRGRTLACDGGALGLRQGERVVIDGGEIGAVVLPRAARPAGVALRRVLRRADARDLARQTAEEQRTAEALGFARARAAARGLPIKVFRAELQPGGRAQFTFAADGRVDFRELVRDLAAQLHARIELRQVGARDEAKLVGGIGSCGRELCCSTFLPKFAPVSIKMAKHQNLALTPSKVSGQCGRLKCCLVYEDDAYVAAAALLPKPGRRVDTPEGVGRVGDVDVLRARVRVYYDDKPPKVFPAADLHDQPNQQNQQSKDRDN
jgi:cell fate regulator YaaT (PSP1 superfamily)